MKIELFEHVLLKLKSATSKSLKLYELGIDLTEAIESDYHTIIDTLIGAHYGEEGEDIISWWLYEDVEKVLEENGKTVELHTIEQLYNYVEKIRNSKDFKDYKLPERLSDEEHSKLLESMKEMFK